MAAAYLSGAQYFATGAQQLNASIIPLIGMQNEN
jgi:hypothetical protein